MKKSRRVWVVVEVESGIPVLAEVYSDRLSAEKREIKLRKELRPDYDEVGVFEERCQSPTRNGAGEAGGTNLIVN
jgi:hypothetical protein